MRDFRDAKAMAHALREALTRSGVETTHSESLELIAKAFGYDNWNILSAKIEAAHPRAINARDFARCGTGAGVCRSSSIARFAQKASTTCRS